MNSQIDLAVFATNLLNKTYILGGYPISQLGFDGAMYGEPRMYGVSLRYNFGGR
jgi:iron complex outermembrane receptor protein